MLSSLYFKMFIEAVYVQGKQYIHTRDREGETCVILSALDFWAVALITLHEVLVFFIC